MQKYRHDYTKVADAEFLLYSAQRLMMTECYYTAHERINKARQLLLEYLASDNMIEDDEVAYGWYRAQEVDKTL